MPVNLLSSTWSSHQFLPAAFTIAIACALVSLTPNLAGATTVLKLDDDDLVYLSFLVVEGRVTGVYSEWNSQHTQIQTVVTIAVVNVFTGAVAANDVLTLRMLGGRVDDTIMEDVGGPTFETGEDVILFLGRDGSGLLTITGLSQGKLSVVADATTGMRVIAGRDVSRDAFVEGLRGRIAAQKAGR